MNSPDQAPLRRVHVHNDLCRDCHACLLACSLDHEGVCSPSLARLTVSKDMARYEFTIRICQHCEDPACLSACPTGAVRPAKDGVLVIVDEECTRCGGCAAACPYEAIFYNAAEDRYLKCDLCMDRGDPLCVTVCPVEALTV